MTPLLDKIFPGLILITPCSAGRAPTNIRLHQQADSQKPSGFEAVSARGSIAIFYQISVRIADPKLPPAIGRWNVPDHQNELFCPVYLIKFDKIVHCNR
jgi:hypothetical protein